MMAILWILIGVVLLALYNSYLILDDRSNYPDDVKIKKTWHFIGALLFCYLSISTCFFFGFKYVLFCLSLFYTIFAGIVHVVALKKPFYFVGTTAMTDILLRKIFPKKTEMASAIIKNTTLAISIILILFL